MCFFTNKIHISKYPTCREGDLDTCPYKYTRCKIGSLISLSTAQHLLKHSLSEPSLLDSL